VVIFQLLAKALISVVAFWWLAKSVGLLFSSGQFSHVRHEEGGFLYS